MGEGELAAFSPPPAAGSAPGYWAEKGAQSRRKMGAGVTGRGFRTVRPGPETLTFAASAWLFICRAGVALNFNAEGAL